MSGEARGQARGEVLRGAVEGPTYTLHPRTGPGVRARNRQFKPTRFPNQPEPAQNRIGFVRGRGSAGLGGLPTTPPRRGGGGPGQSNPTRIALTFQSKPRIIRYPTSKEAV